MPVLPAVRGGRTDGGCRLCVCVCIAQEPEAPCGRAKPYYYVSITYVSHITCYTELGKRDNRSVGDSDMNALMQNNRLF